MARLWIGMTLALALAGCRTEQDTGKPRSRSESAPGVTALMPPVPAPRGGEINTPFARRDAGAADAGALIAPPSTAMPSVRPVYPAPDAGARR